MEETQNIIEEQPKEKLYSQKEFDEYKQELEKKLKQEMEKASMSELELAQTELAELKEKYKQKEDECMLAKQKEQTAVLLNEANLDSSLLDVVLVAKDEEKTKNKIAVLKNYIENIKKNILQGCIGAPVPLTSGAGADYDPFIEGFDTNKL